MKRLTRQSAGWLAVAAWVFVAAVVFWLLVISPEVGS